MSDTVYKAELLRIQDPFNFWIAKKSPLSFLKVISQHVRKDVEASGQAIGDAEDFIARRRSCINTRFVVAVYHDIDKCWYRARIHEVNKTVQSGQGFLCDLIDKGQTITVPLNKVRFLSDTKLTKLPPLARKCTLYGLTPVFPQTDLPMSKWAPAATKFFYDMCDPKRDKEIFVQYESDAVTSADSSEVPLRVRIFVKSPLRPNEEYYDMNDLLVRKQYAAVKTQPVDEVPRGSRRAIIKEQLDEAERNFSDLETLRVYLESSAGQLSQSQVRSILDEFFGSSAAAPEPDEPSPSPPSAEWDEEQEQVSTTPPESTSDDTEDYRPVEREAPPAVAAAVETVSQRPRRAEKQRDAAQSVPSSSSNSNGAVTVSKTILDSIRESKKTSVQTDTYLSHLQRNILVQGDSWRVCYGLGDKKIRLQPFVHDYLRTKGRGELSDLQAVGWLTVARCRPCVFVAKEYKDSQNAGPGFHDIAFTYLCPILSFLQSKKMKEADDDESGEDENANKIVVKAGDEQKTVYKTKNGPILLIVCASCDDAQRLYALVSDMVKMVRPARKQLKTIILQGGGDEDQYAVPLMNGCEILIAATPYPLVRMLGSNRTNLQRLRHLVFDEASLLMDRYRVQIRALMHSYFNMIRINESLPIAQFLVFSRSWSTQLKKFVETHISDPVVVFTNKLEASFFGRTHHVVNYCLGEHEKLAKFKDIVANLSTSALSKNTVVFTYSKHTAYVLLDEASKLGLANVFLVHEGMHSLEIKSVESKWEHASRHNASDMATPDPSGFNTNAILICTQLALNQLELDNAQCIVHYDFPRTKTVFENRLWLLRSYFGQAKEAKSIRLPENGGRGVESDEPDGHEFLNDHATIRNQLEFVNSSKDRLCSYLFLTAEDQEYSEDLLSYLQHIGVKHIPAELSKMALENRLKKENAKASRPLCPFVKAYAQCMSKNPISCQYRHLPNKTSDKMEALNEGYLIPNEGYIKFRVAHVEDTNHIFINLLGHEDLDKSSQFSYDAFINFDIDLQMYYSNPANIKYAKKFQEGDHFALKDIDTSLYQRVCIIDILQRDAKVGYEVLVKCVDVGSKYQVSTMDLIELPQKFKTLPPQAIEVYLCDIRPIDGDINWSLASKMFVAKKLSKHKELYGKIVLGAERTLWIHSISNFKYLEALDMNIVSDSVRLEIIQNNYGVKYETHMKTLKELFEKNGLHVPKEEISFDAYRNFGVVYEHLYPEGASLKDMVHFAFLREGTNEEYESINQVFVSAIDTPSEFFVQNAYSVDLLERLNADIDAHVKLAQETVHKASEKRAQIREDGDDDDEAVVDLEMSDFIRRAHFVQAHLNRATFEIFNLKNKPFYCLAKQRREKKYFRAQLVDYQDEAVGQETPGDKLTVFFVDFGDFDVIDKSDVYPMPEKFIRIAPFQAIRCRIDGVKPIPFLENFVSTGSRRNAKWMPRAAEALWKLTHDQDNYYQELDAFVMGVENTPENEEESNEADGKAAPPPTVVRKSILKTSVNYRARVYNGYKQYSIKLMMRDRPIDLDLAHKLVAQRWARFTKQEEKAIFTKPKPAIAADQESEQVDDELKSMNELAEAVVNNLVRNRVPPSSPLLGSRASTRPNAPKSGAVGKHTCELLKTLKAKREAIEQANSKTVASSNLITALANSLYFIQSSEVLCELIDFIRNMFLDSNVPGYWIEFVQTRGLYNMFWIIKSPADYSQTLVSKIYDTFDEMLGKHQFANQLIKKRFLKGFWVVLGNSTEDLYAERCLRILERLAKMDFELKADVEFYVDRALRKLNQVALSEPVVATLKQVHASFMKKKKVEEIDGGREDENEPLTEEQEKVNRVLEFVRQTSEQPAEKEADHESVSSRSSDESVNRQFVDDLLKMMQLGNLLKSNNFPESYPPRDSMWEPKDYVYPKLSWDQTNETVVLKVLLKNVKERTVNFSSRKIEFRAQVNSIEYGFDLELYAEIDPAAVTSETKSNMVLINLNKIIMGKWPRLLATVNKPHFIKSEYDNINDESSDEEEKAQKKAQEFSELFDYKDRKNLGKVRAEAESEISDSDSNFDDEICNDLDEPKDIYWD